MGFQPTPWQMAAYFWEGRRKDLIGKLPGSMWLIGKYESTDKQDRMGVRPYEVHGYKQHSLGPNEKLDHQYEGAVPITNTDPPNNKPAIAKQNNRQPFSK